MKNACFLSGWMIAGLLIASPSAWAQIFGGSPRANQPEQPADKWQMPAEKWARAELEATFKRELKTEKVETTLQRKLDRPEPELLGQKFAASVRLELPKRLGPNHSPFDFIIHAQGENAGDDPLMQVLKFNVFVDQRGFSSLLNRREGNFTYGSEGTAANSLLNQLISLVPAGRLKPGETDFLKDGDSRSYLVPLRDASPDKFQMVCLVYGTSPEQCLKNVNTLLTVLDEGMSRPVQLLLFDARPRQVERFAEIQKQMKADEAEREAARASLKSLVDLTPDLMLGLKQQQLAMEVEVAGLRAKAEVCQKLLVASTGKDEVSVAQRAAIAAAKVEAEIALATSEARRAKLGELVTSVKTKTDLSRKVAELSQNMSIHHHELREAIKLVNAIDGEIERYAPLPVADNKVVIQPVEWVSP